MRKYRIIHEKRGDREYYNAQVFIPKEKGTWIFGRDACWYTLRGIKGYIGTLEDAKEIIYKVIAEDNSHTDDFKDYIEYP